jgi:streptogramin lyase
VISKALAKAPEGRYPTCGALVVAAEGALGLRRPARFGRRAAALVAAIVVVASLAVGLVVPDGRGPKVPPRSHDNTLVRIDPQTNAVQRVIDVGSQPMAVAAWGRTVWLYSSGAGVVSEVDAHTNHVLHTTPLSVTPVDLRPVAGPVLAADANGAWLVGVDRRGRSLLTLVPTGGGRRNYVLQDRPVAVATGLRAVWVLERGARGEKLLRLDPATGTMAAEARFPASARVDSMTVAFRDVWLVSSSTAMLYRFDPRLAAIDHVDLGQSAARPNALFGAVWVGVSDNGGDTVVVDPKTLTSYSFGCCAGSMVNGDNVEAFDSAWSYDVADGEVQRWDPPNLAHVTQITDAPLYDGSCMTSITAGGGAVWVTLAPSVNYSCNS